MTDRVALADRLEALIRDLRFDDGRLNNIRVATFVRFNDVDILAALREPGFAAGAEAMREAAVGVCQGLRLGLVKIAAEMEQATHPGDHDFAQQSAKIRSLKEQISGLASAEIAIRALPLPEPKP